jgi:tellurite resistance protein TehA-like permease
MTVFESLNNTADKATETAERYVKNSKGYVKLKIFQQLAISLSLATKFAIIGGMVSLGLIFVSIAGALAIGKQLDNVPLGFVIIGLLFLVFALIIYTLRKKINKKIIKELSEKFFD